MQKAIFLVTGTDHWTLDDGTKHPTGFWADELVAPHRKFRAAGIDITIATPGAVKPVVDQGSLDPEQTGGEEESKELRKYLDSIDDQLGSAIAIESVDVDDYDLVFVPGGHGPMEDLAVDPQTGRVLTQALDAGKPVSLVCHAPAAMLSARRSDGSWTFDGFEMTGFSNVEEKQAGLADKAPWLLEDRLEKAGGRYESGEAWAPKVVVDRNLYTGQNPASAGPLADRVIQDLPRA